MTGSTEDPERATVDQAHCAPAGTIVITGIMASGKSTVAQALAERIPMSVHLRGDVFRRFIVNGRAEMEPILSDAAFAQLKLRYDLATIAARRYRDAGFTVIYQDIMLGTSLTEVVANLRPGPVTVVVLCPSIEAVHRREAGRVKTAYVDWTVEELDRMLRDETPRIGLWLDTSRMSVDETVDEILAYIARAEAASADIFPDSSAPRRSPE